MAFYAHSLDLENYWLPNTKIQALSNNPQIGCTIIESHPMKCAKHGSTANSWIANRNGFQILPLTNSYAFWFLSLSLSLSLTISFLSFLHVSALWYNLQSRGHHLTWSVVTKHHNTSVNPKHVMICSIHIAVWFLMCHNEKHNFILVGFRRWKMKRLCLTDWNTKIACSTLVQYTFH